MKKITLILLGLVFGVSLSAQAASVLFPYQGGTGTGSVPSYGQMLVGNSSGTYTLTATSSLGITGTGGSGGTGTVSTSTIPTVGQLAYWTSNGFPSLLGSVATTTLTLSGFPANIPSTLGSLVGGSNTTWTWWGLATSSNISTASGFLYATGANTVASIATSSAIQMSITGNAGTVTNGVYTTDTGTVTNTMLAGSIANSKLANSTISGIALGSNLATLTFGTHVTGTSYNGSTAATIATDATDANTASTIVARDASGNFSAGAITLGTALTVGNGGTGQTSFTSGNLLYGSGSGAIQNVATTTIAVGTGISVTSGTLGYQIGGANVTLGIAANALTLAQFPTIGANSVIGNLTGGTATPTAVATSSLFSWNGTGLVVRDTSPTFTTPTLGAATATTINKITLTQPATGSTLTLIDGKTLTINKTMSFTAADDTGVYTLPTGTKTLLATDGSIAGLTGTISSTVLGNSTLYIGTTAVLLNRPTGNLVLTGITSIDGNAATVTTNANLTGVITSSGNATSWGTLAKGNFLVGNDSNIAQATSTIFISSLGNVGIGTTSPGYKLVVGTTRKLNVIPDYGGQGEIRANSVLFTSSSGDLAFFPNTDTGAVGDRIMMGYFNGGVLSAAEIANVASGYGNLLLMKSGGNVGIGTTSPYSMLSVAGQIVGQNFVATSTTATSTFSGGLSVGNNGALIVNQTATANSLYINSSGNVGIATTTPNTKLNIFGGGIGINPGATSIPTCSVATRGMVWNTFGAAGVADTFQVCQKDAADAYSWVTK